MIEVVGQCGITARVLKDSLANNVRLLSMEVEYPRIILAELNTHRMIAKNSSSSRAIPFAKMLDQLVGRPVRFGQANPGMQDKGVDFDGLIADPFRPEHGFVLSADEAWEQAKEDAKGWSMEFFDAGFHKQVYNRLTEPFQMMKTVVSATEWENFFWLRNHGAADPTIAELARVMLEAKLASTPQTLSPGEWHLPYVGTYTYNEEGLNYFIIDEQGYRIDLTLEQARWVSAARSAAVSFRNIDYGVEKCREVHNRLVTDERVHGSALEHQATPMAIAEHNFYSQTQMIPEDWEEGVSHMDRQCRLWSGPFRGWIQYRKLIPGENKEN